MYSAKSEQMVETGPITKINGDQLRRKRASYNALWLGRVVVLLSLTAQYCGTTVLFIRRAKQSYPILVWDLDIRNLGMALGGLTAVVTSLVNKPH